MKTNRISRAISKLSFSWLALGLIAYFVVDRHLQYELWNKSDGVFISDAKAYYAYLPAYFIEGDLSLGFIEQTPERSANYWYSDFSDFKLIKMTSGLAILSTPFFLVAHLLNYGSATGFEAPFKVSMIVSALFYLFLGLYFLKRLLRSYVSDKVTTITLLLVALGTNLWYYSIEEVFMSHVFSFSLIAVFLYHVLGSRKAYSGLAWWITFGVLVGFISLIRPTNILVLLIPIVHKRHLLFEMFKKQWLAIIISILCAISIWFPQLLYWKINTGDWLFFSYGEEGFNFLSPEIWKGLFGFRKGFFVYTPLMLLIIPGVYFLYKNQRELFLPFSIFFVFNVYVIFSWWCWWYGGSFGSRPMIDTYALNALCIALLVEAVLKSKVWVAIPVYLMLFAGVQLNRYQTQQYRLKIIHWDAMTKEAYLFTLFENPEAPEVEQYLDKPEYYPIHSPK